MENGEVRSLEAQFREATTSEERVQVVERCSATLDPDDPEQLEQAATRLAGSATGTIEFAYETLALPDLEPRVRFLVFSIAAIACRRASDRQKTRKLFRLAGSQFTDQPLFKHLQALSYDHSNLQDLERGLKLEREAYKELQHHAGAAHAIASFLLQIADHDGSVVSAERPQLREALGYVETALSERPGYAKFYYTRGAIYRRLGEFQLAREALLKAVELEDRTSVDAADRLRDYRLEMTLIGIEQTVRSLDVGGLKRDLGEAVERLQRSETSVIAAIAFIAAALGLVQITSKIIEQRPFIEAIGLVGTLGFVLFAAMALGTWVLRRR